MSELKPCPFCGKTTSTEFSHDAAYCYSCIDNDGCLTPESWNSRPIEDALRARVAELETEVERLRGGLKKTLVYLEPINTTTRQSVARTPDARTLIGCARLALDYTLVGGDPANILVEVKRG